ncbi:hypothetical protein F4553_003239 [Allocatelliglobosispora scoriae]|uniref:Uncharacterized protein n=1 Tax=Allocatelliglobosispora scoriae TaxID=643052 RepID=A0A841BSU4_9ACTN|nr:hypothetical protein [Allocatelliglobosispora scoriae]MBB5869860.1 hypothetical protein [Allocatelliglobosispora scoriae]
MRAYKIATRIAAAALAAGGSTLLFGAAPARADTVFIEVNPSTINAGFSVSLRASCGSTVNPATAKSDAFGVITLMAEKNFLIGTATIPSDTKPHGYPVKLTCASGSTAITTLWVINPTKPTKGPNTGGGALAHQGNGPLVLGGSIAAICAGLGLGIVTLRRRRSAYEA